jgi:hypothetical protein
MTYYLTIGPNGDDQQFLQYQQKEQPYLTLRQWTQKDHDIYRCISRSCLLSRATLTQLIRLETNLFRIKLNLLLLAKCPNINNKNDWLRWDYVMNERVAQYTFCVLSGEYKFDRLWCDPTGVPRSIVFEASTNHCTIVAVWHTRCCICRINSGRRNQNNVSCATRSFIT